MGGTTREQFLDTFNALSLSPTTHFIPSLTSSWLPGILTEMPIFARHCGNLRALGFPDGKLIDAQSEEASET